MSELQNVFGFITEPRKFVYVDNWTPEPEDMIFTHTKGAIILNEICRMFSLPDDSPVAYFIMSKKRCYNSDTISNEAGDMSIGFRDHCTKYLNYFEKFYDYEDHYLVGIFAQMKYMMEYVDEYNEEGFMQDLRRYMIDHEACPLFHFRVERFVEDNYHDHLMYRNIKNPCLEYNDFHAKILMKISFIQNAVIPLIMQFVYVKNYSTAEIERILMRAFDLIFVDCYKKFHVDMIAKLFETVFSNVNKNVSNNKTLWDMQQIRARNNTTQSMSTIENIITKIMPKYTFSKHIICFNFGVINSDIRFNVTGIPYEYTLTPVSSSIRDEDNNSQADKFEAYISKIDEAMVLQENVTCDYTMKKIVQLFGPFDDNEIAFYMNELGKNGKPIKNAFQSNLISYLFLKYFKDIKAIKLVNYRDYIILMLAAKKYLISEGQSLLPFILGGRVERLVSRKTINKKILQRMEISESYPKVVAKYNNKKIQEDIIFKIISQILASEFRNIDYHDLSLNGVKIECIPEKVCEEVLQYILLI